MVSTFPLPKQHLIGHRGVAGLRPENTFCGFSLAAELGLNWIEFDVQLSKDDVWIVMHDATLDRTTNGRGLVAEHTAVELGKLEAGLWFRPPYAEQAIPTLKQALQLAHQLGIFCNVELKVPENAANKYASLCISFLQQNPFLVNDKIILSTFDLDCAQQLANKLQQVNLKVPIAFLTESVTPQMLPTIVESGFAALNCDVEKFSREVLLEANKLQLPVFLYTINDKSIARFWIGHGVSGVFTDRPDLLQHTSSMAY